MVITKIPTDAQRAADATSGGSGYIGGVTGGSTSVGNNTGDVNWASPAGNGGASGGTSPGADGSSGRIVISYTQ